MGNRAARESKASTKTLRRFGSKPVGACPHYASLKAPNLHIDSLRYSFFGTSLARPSVAQELAAQMIGVNSFALPGEPSGVDREIIGQLPSGV